MDLPEFDLSQVQHGDGNNTIAIKFTAPEDSNRFRYIDMSRIIFVAVLNIITP